MEKCQELQKDDQNDDGEEEELGEEEEEEEFDSPVCSYHIKPDFWFFSKQNFQREGGFPLFAETTCSELASTC